ncbi:GIY-YIG nuclease family protein [Candidatus Kaiserbacteria bacterium]|nr:MAG: GIY-YIG nuclease family protein [Candidatus Kaiserbacteria bacterium]
MQREKIHWKDVPNTPGVYFFLGVKKDILYIGKATSLKQRLASYFGNDIAKKRSFVIEKMVADAVRVEWMQTDSVLEAMLIETNLIRTHKPVCNTRSKDDKSFNHVIITDEKFPRILVVRGKDLASYTYTHEYGPFPNGTLFREALKIIRKLFQFYDIVAPLDTYKNKMHKGKVDFNRQIGLYPEQCTPVEYARTIRHIRLFFEGKKEKIVADLEKQMHSKARAQKFEEALVLKKKIFALHHIQDVSLLKREVREYRDNKSMRIEAYDVAHMQGDAMVGVMTVVNRGETVPSEYRKFIIKECNGPDDTRALTEILTRRLKHEEWTLPDLIVVDGSTAQRNAALRVLEGNMSVIPVVGVVKDEHHKPHHCIGPKNMIAEHKDAILLANAESHRFAITFHRKKRKPI